MTIAKIAVIVITNPFNLFQLYVCVNVWCKSHLIVYKHLNWARTVWMLIVMKV